MAIVCSPTAGEPTHHFTLSDGVTKVGFKFTNPNGDLDHRAIRREPMPVTSFKQASGETKYDDFEPPYTPVAQDNWSGGLGNLEFDGDTEKYLRGWRMDATRANQVILGPRFGYATGIRSCDQHVPYMTASLGRVQNEFLALVSGTNFRAMRFTASASYTAVTLSAWVRKVGTPPAALTLALYSVAAGEPDTLLASDTVAVASVTDTLSQMVKVTVLYALTSGTEYALVVSSSTGGSVTNCWTVLAEYAVGGTGHEGPGSGIWVASDYELFFRVTPAEVGVRPFFFEYKRQLFCALNYANTETPKVFVNGYQGVATAATSTTLTDSTQSWVTNALVGAQVEVFVGQGSNTPRFVRWVVSNTSTQITVNEAWEVTPGAVDSEYNVKGVDVWTEVTGHNMSKRIRSVLSVRFNAYFAQGEDTAIMRMRRFNSGGWTTEWARETAKASHLQAVEDETDGFVIWKAREGYPSTVARSEAPYGGGAGQVADTNQGSLSYGFASLKDTGQDFGDWDVPLLAGVADYLIVVTDSTGEVSWGYMGAASESNQRIAVYQDRSLLRPGWNGRAGLPQALSGPGTPSSYIVFAAQEKASEVGVMTATTTTFKDADRDLKEWEDTSGDASYVLILWDTAGLVSWGYLGAVSTTGNRTIAVYTDLGRTTGGWNGDDGAGTPAGYVIVAAASVDTNQGTLSYGVPSLTDASQAFADWETREGDALYVITVIDSDGEVNWGYMGEAMSATSIAVYKDIERTQRGWKGDDEDLTVLGTPSSYGVQWAVDVLRFGEEITVGDTMERTTGLEAYGEPERLWVLKEGHLYNVEGTTVRRVPLRELQAAAGLVTGQAHTTSNVYLMFNLKNSIERFYNSNLDDVGPMAGEGLPDNLQGVVSFLVSYPGRVYVGIDGGSAHYSSVLCWNTEGYHEVYRSGIVGRRIQGGTVQALEDPAVSRLWFSEGSDLVWIPVALNPFQERETNGLTQRYQFAWEGAMESSWHNIRLKDVYKYFQGLTLFCERLNTDGSVVVKADYRLDKSSNAWAELPDVFDTSPIQKIVLANPVTTPGSITYPTTGRRVQYRLRFLSIYGDETPRLLSVVLDAISRVPVKYRYNMQTRLKDEDVDIQGLGDAYVTLPSTVVGLKTVQQLDALLDAWVQTPTVLTTECVFNLYHNKTVMVDPLTSQPVGLVFGEHEEHAASVSLIEV